MKKKNSWKFLAIVFLVNFLCAACALLPRAFSFNGILTLAEDFNAETIPWYYLMNDAFHSGEVFWNWNIDIGSEFGTAFGHLFCSPFTWLAIIVPKNWIPYVSVWILILKYATAGLTSYLYISRYVKHRENAVIGSLVYAFSGYQAINLVFNIFDCAIFFPLLLYAMDNLVLDNKRGGFALAVCLNSFVGFTFFVQSVIICVLYYIVRFWIGDKNGWRHIGKCMLEGIIGVGLSAVAFFPQIIEMLGNPRAQTKLPGSRWLSYSTLEVLLLIRAWLLPADAMSNGSSIIGAEWSSCNGYLPLIGIVLVLAFCRKNRKHWLVRTLLSCLLIMCIPVFSSIFTLGGDTLYRRWFYYPVLMCALASCVFIDREIEEKDSNTKIWTESAAIIGVIALFTIFVYYVDWDGIGNNIVFDESRFTWQVAIACIGIIVTAAVWKFAKKSDRGIILLICVYVSCVLTTYTAIGDYQLSSNNGPGENKTNEPQEVYNELFNTTKILDDIEVWPYRTVAWNNYYNYNMIMAQPARQSFHSIVHNSISELYEMLGTPRTSAMTPYGPECTDEVLSTKYFILNYEIDTLTKVAELDTGNYVAYLYEDENALPLGFTYDLYMTRSEFLTYPSEVRAAIMLKVLVVKDEDESIVQDVLDHYDESIHGEISVQNRNAYQDEHLLECGSDHQMTNRGDFSFNISASEEKYVFISVPYSTKWQATVNGEAADILNINGLMAVRVNEGTSNVSFYYSMSFNRVCLIVNIIFIGIYAVYMVTCRRKFMIAKQH